MRGRLVLVLVLALLALLASLGQTAAASAAETADSPEARFTRYLARLGLVDLQILHLEERFERETETARRVELARNLADLYAGQMIASSDDSAKYQRLEARIQRLVTQVPESRTASLEVTLLQADYHRAERLIEAWIAAPADTASRDAAATLLTRIAPQLDQRQAQLRKTVNTLLDEVDLMEAGDERDAKEIELARLQSVAGRATYFAAWSNYYLFRAVPGAESALARARDIFRHLLGLGDGYAEVEAELLGLESIWRSRSLVGLALAEAALGHADDSLTCFGFLAHPSVPPEVRDQAPYWRLESLLSTRQFDEALAYARQHVGKFSSHPTQGKISFCVHLVRAAYARPEGPPPNAGELGTLGMAGLVKLRQLDIVKQVMEQYHIPLDAANGFYLQWIQGQRLLEVASQSKTRDDCTAAAAKLSEALQAPDASQDLGAAAQCRYQLGWCLYQIEDYEAAARSYESAISGLQAVGDDTAVQAAWAAFLAYHKLVKSQPRFVSSAIDVLNRIKRDFSEHEYARRADYQIGKLREGAVAPAETLDRLQAVPAGSPDYLDARYDICVLLHKQWASSEGAGQDAAAEKVFSAVDVYLDAATPATDGSRLLKACLLAAEVGSDGRQGAGYLDKAQTLAEAASADGRLAADYHYRRLQQATSAKDEAARRQHANWIVQNASGSAYELPALVIVARALDAALQSDENPPRAQLEEAFRVYERLVALWGDTPETLAANKNARTASSRLAHYASHLERFDEAALRLERLLQAFPKDKGYLRRAGLAYFQADQYERSLDPWRTLLAGLPKASDGWYEAKYYQVACLFRTDSKKAKLALEQFLLLYPDLPANWRDRFTRLEKG